MLKQYTSYILSFMLFTLVLGGFLLSTKYNMEPRIARADPYCPDYFPNYHPEDGYCHDSYFYENEDCPGGPIFYTCYTVIGGCPGSFGGGGGATEHCVDPVLPLSCSIDSGSIATGDSVGATAYGGSDTGYYFTAEGGSVSSTGSNSISVQYDSPGSYGIDVATFDETAHCGDVTVTTPTPPTASIGAYPSPVEYDTTTGVSWSSQNANNCNSSQGAGFETGGATSGNDDSWPLTSAETSTVVCTGDGGTASDSVTVDVTPPPNGDLGVNLRASPVSGQYPASLTLLWTPVNNPDLCTASDEWTGNKATTGGSQNMGTPALGNHTYTITCTKSGFSPVSDSATFLAYDLTSPPACTSSSPQVSSTTATSGLFYVYAYGVINASSVTFPTDRKSTRLNSSHSSI